MNVYELATIKTRLEPQGLHVELRCDNQAPTMLRFRQGPETWRHVSGRGIDAAIVQSPYDGQWRMRITGPRTDTIVIAANLNQIMDYISAENSGVRDSRGEKIIAAHAAEPDTDIRPGSGAPLTNHAGAGHARRDRQTESRTHSGVHAEAVSSHAHSLRR